MTVGYRETDVNIITLPTLPNNVPYVVDDFSLATSLGFRNQILWWILTKPDAHYEMFNIPKSKRGKFRYIHSPAPAMKLLSERLNKRFLDPLQNKLGPHVTAYRHGHSITDAVKSHIRKCPICDEAPKGATPANHNCPKKGTYIHMDLRDFFTRTSRAWVRNYFKSLGYSHTVASYLSALTTVSNIPNPVRKRRGNKDEIAETVAGVPQGAPTSGAICNLIADKKLDPILLSLMRTLNLRDNLTDEWGWRYTRYSDDLTFTCGKEYTPAEQEYIVKQISSIINTSGYRVNKAKTVIAQGYSRKKMLGVVFNQVPNYPRKEYMRIRAITHNCLTHGFKAEYEKAGCVSVPKFVSWLRGKINWINQINPTKGAALLQEFNEALELHKPLDTCEVSNA